MSLAAVSAAAAAEPPLVISLSATTGTPEWDESAGAGLDTGPDNDVIRTNDIATYVVNVASEQAQTAVVTLTLPRGQEFRTVPAFCNDPDNPSLDATPSPAAMPEPAVPLTAAAWLALPVQSLTCSVVVPSGSSQFLSFPAWQRSEVPNGTNLDSATVSATSDLGEDPITAAQDVSMTVSAAPKWDVSKNGIAVQENTGYYYANFSPCTWDSSLACRLAIYPLFISGNNGGKGQTPLTGPVTITDLLNPTSYYGTEVTGSETWTSTPNANELYAPRLNSCAINPEGAYLSPSNQDDPETSVRDSGTIASCEQVGGAGNDATITITNTDWSLYTYPTRIAVPAGAIPDSKAYAVSVHVTIEEPVAAVLEFGESDGVSWTLNVRNEYTDFTATGLDGTVQAAGVDAPSNNFRQSDVAVRATEGSFDKFFVGVRGDENNTSATDFRPGFPVAEGPPASTTARSGITPIGAGQTVLSLLTIGGSSFALPTPGAALMCDAWDNTKLQLQAGDWPGGGSLGQLYASEGAAVWLSGNQAAPAPQYTVEYSGDTISGAGAGAGSTCRSGEWFDDPAQVPGNDPDAAAEGVFTAVTQVRIWSTIEEPSADSTFQWYSVALRAVSGLAPGTNVPNWASATVRFGEKYTKEQLLEMDPNPSGSTYNPETHGGTPGDRLIFTPAYVRLVQEVSTNGGEYSELADATAGDAVTWRVRPQITSTSPSTTQAAQPVMVEECLPPGVVFESASVLPQVAQAAPAPADAEITCEEGTYLRFRLGDFRPGQDIPELLINTRISEVAPAGTYTSNASVQTNPGDPSPVSARSDDAQVHVTQIAGLKIDKLPLTPLVEVNPDGNEGLELNVWQLSLVNSDSPTPLSNIDMIDVLPRDGVNGTSFDGSFTLVSVEVTQGDDVQVLYTSASSVDSNARAESNGSGGIAWCEASEGTVISGEGECPASLDEVTGLRFQRPGVFANNARIDVLVMMVAEGNTAGDEYVNVVEAAADGLVFNAGPATATETATASSVGDFVWYDLDGDGLQGVDEPPVAGFPVMLSGFDDLENAVERTTVTDASGAYLFEDLRSGEYVVTFDPEALDEGESFTVRGVGEDRERDADGDPTTGVTDELSLESSTDMLDIDQGILVERGSIGDFVWIDRNDNGVQDSGETPVADFPVTLTGTDPAGNQINTTVRTNADGRYLFDELLPGTYTVTFDPTSVPAGHQFVQRSVGTDRAADSDGDPATGRASGIVLAAGEDRLDIDQGLRVLPAPGGLVVTAPTPGGLVVTGVNMAAWILLVAVTAIMAGIALAISPRTMRARSERARERSAGGHPPTD